MPTHIVKQPKQAHNVVVKVCQVHTIVLDKVPCDVLARLALGTKVGFKHYLPRKIWKQDKLV